MAPTLAKCDPSAKAIIKRHLDKKKVKNVVFTSKCTLYRAIVALSIKAFGLGGLGNLFFLTSTPSLAFTTASQPTDRLINQIKNDDNPPPDLPGPIVPRPTRCHRSTVPPSRRPTVSASSRHRVAEHSSSSVARRRWPVDASARSGQVSTGFVFCCTTH